MFPFWGVFSFIFGTIVGSFINVVVERIDSKESIFFGRSHCPYCKKVLKWYELIPILNYFYLKGRCSRCKNKIPLQYPLVEFITGLFFFLVSRKIFPFLFSYYLNTFSGFYLIKWLFLFHFLFIFYWIFVLITVSIYDLKKYLILNEILWPAIIISLLWRVVFGIGLELDKVGLGNLFVSYLGNYKYIFGYYNYWISLFLGILLSSLPIAFIVLISKEQAMGWGDVILAAFIGLILGYPEALLALVLSFLIGGLVSILLICLKKKSFKSYIPFAPFLSLGALLVLIFGDIIIYEYIKLWIL